MKKEKITFDQWYEHKYGDRWASLKASLLLPNRSFAYSHALLKPYFLDSGSVEVAKALPLEGANSILDLCAAPGGKTLVIASTMDDQAQLTSNDFSRERKKRLQLVISEHVPESIADRINITGRDACTWSRFEQSRYDRILLDAPCSSERHVLASKKYLAQWSPARIKNLSYRQWAMLSGAWLVLKPGGFLVYSTCALSYEENDYIIEKLIKKYSDVEMVIPLSKSITTERSKFGYYILPDTSDGAGPLFYSLLQKKES